MSEKPRLFAEDVERCGRLTARGARARGWHPMTMRAAVRRGLVSCEWVDTRSGLDAYALYRPANGS